MAGALNTYLPNAAKVPTYGGSTFWVEGPEGLDADALTKTALENGIVIEPMNESNHIMNTSDKMSVTDSLTKT